jgi:hypothetical protein
LRIIENMRLSPWDDAFSAPKTAVNVFRYSRAENHFRYQVTRFLDKNAKDEVDYVAAEAECSPEEAATELEEVAAELAKQTDRPRKDGNEALAIFAKKCGDTMCTLLTSQSGIDDLSCNESAGLWTAEQLPTPAAPAKEAGVDVELHRGPNPDFTELNTASFRLDDDGIERLTGRIDSILEQRCFATGRKLDDHQQRWVKTTCVDCLLRPGGDSEASTQAREILIGGPGVGKSETLRAFIEVHKVLAGDSSIAGFAYTGTAAVNLHSVLPAETVCSGFKIGRFGFCIRKKGDSVDDIAWLQNKFRTVQTIVIDEVSQISTSVLFQISRRLQQAKSNTVAYGGCNVVVVGDFLQAPPCSGVALYFGRTSRPEGNTTDLDDFNLTELTTQHRAGKSDPVNDNHRRVLSLLRQPNTAREGWDLFFSNIQSTAKNSVTPNATVLVYTNQARTEIGNVRKVHFAASMGLPVLWIRLAKIEYFHVKGMPGMCLINKDVANAMTNGALVIERGLTLTSHAELQRLRQYIAANGRPGIVLDSREFNVTSIVVSNSGESAKLF